MEAQAQNKTAATINGLEIKLAIAKEYKRFAGRVLPCSGEFVGAIIHALECEWAVEDAKRVG